MRRKHLSYFGIGIYLLCLAGLAHAGIPLGTDRIRLSGFATLGAVRGGTETLGFRRDLERDGVFDDNWSMKIDSLVGLQLDADITDTLSAATQVVYKDRTDASFKDYLDWIYLRYRFGPSWTARIGRLGANVFILSDFRDLGFAYLWVRPPGEFYTPIIYNHIDGADLSFSSPLGVGTFTAKTFYGQTNVTNNTFGADLKLALKALGGNIGWESEKWLARFSIVNADVKVGQDFLGSTDAFISLLQSTAVLWPELTNYTNAFSLNNKSIYYYALGVAYDNKPWVVQSELDYVDTGTPIFRSFSSGYVSVGYRIGDVTPYGMLAKIKNTVSRTQVSDPPTGTGYDAQLVFLQQKLQGVFDAASFGQHSVSLGMRWDIRYDLALKLQWDHAWVDAFGSGLWDQRSVLDHDETMNTFSINLNGVF